MREKNDPAEERGRFAWGARALSAHAPCIRHAADMCGGISTCAEERGNEVSLMLHGSRGLSFIYLFPLSFGILPLHCTVERAAIQVHGERFLSERVSCWECDSQGRIPLQNGEVKKWEGKKKM
ncbi:hypothetical protein TNCT_628091 [Trichonephila clavata]|uniref:Uncharacterized protein n=1 Tax=Trichonephila clavata TaxID=2740835 RepID=A0A8X6FTV2_TRICU|nr:hypothetical protein TNCT_628091 [Trichonephila clavata]